MSAPDPTYELPIPTACAGCRCEIRVRDVSRQNYCDPCAEKEIDRLRSALADALARAERAEGVVRDLMVAGMSEAREDAWERASELAAEIAKRGAT